MKKKFLILALAFLVGLPSTIALSGCGDKNNVDTRTILNSEMISLEYSYTMYTGIAKEPEVVVELNNLAVSENDYNVQYLNNTDAGVADVVVSANANSDIIVGSASTNFTITAARIKVETYEDLKSILTNSNYSVVNLDADITVPAGETLTVESSKTIDCGNYKLTNNGTIINNGKIKINADSKESFEEVMQFASHITLTNDIVLKSGEKLNIDADVANKNINLDIDLNGYSIVGYVRVGAKTNQATVNIKDYRQIGSIGTETTDYGVIAIGNNANISLFGVKVNAYYAAVATNGIYEGGSITATNCSFTASSTEIGGNSGLGAYLPAKYSYSFINCEFTGSSAYYTKSGTHSLTNCVFNGTQTSYENPKHNGSGGNATGSALVVDSSKGYLSPLMLTLFNGQFTSVSGYGIEEYCSGNAEDYSTTSYYGTLTYNVAKDNYKQW